MMVEIASRVSGDYIETEFGELRHGNGRFGFSGLKRKLFYFSDIPENIAAITVKGAPHRYSWARFNVPLLEEWVKKRLT